MLNYILSRLFSAFIVIFGVVFIVFMLIHMVPGDPVEVMLAESATAIDRQALRLSLGLDKPLWQQFYHFLQGLIHFDLGHSLHSKKAISELISARIGPTIELTMASLLVAFMIAFPLGIFAALKKDQFA
ncbi:MAG: ABC transporter permease, partial [Thiotrichaceae bacterium]|nr:ABC transporter permease [Thiotrichaceae bacterium]